MLSRIDRLKFASQNVAQPLPPLIAPVKGWNTRDALDAMDSADAVLLDNWFPDAGGVVVRNGYASYATGVGAGAVQTLAEYSAGAINKFIAAASGKFYDISAAGVAGAPLATGFGSDQWQHVHFLGKLFFFNGTDTAQVFDGTSFANSTFTGVSLSTLVGGVIYQQRLFAWQNNSTKFWFAPLNSITGALSSYDLSAFTPHGGNLVAAITYSHDGGNGVLDFIVFVMSSGDALIYFGNDPSDFPNNWQLVGIYRISPPVSPRAVCNYGAEAFLTTYDDHVPLSQQLVALREGRLPPRSKVSGAVRAAVMANGAAFGWQALYYPAGRRLIFNVPNPDGSFSQHIQNTGITYIDPNTNLPCSPWCRFQNMNGSCFGLFKNKLYFGAAGGVVYQADIGTLDVLGTVNANGQQSWNIFQNPERKRITAARPLVQSQGQTSYSFKLGYDYGNINIPITGATPGGGSPWNTSPWNTSAWSPEQQVSTLWHAAGGTGVAISAALSIAATNGATWLRTDFKNEIGSTL